MSAEMSLKFHGLVDQAPERYAQVLNPAFFEPIVQFQSTTITDRQLHHTVAVHDHRYVTDLIRRLITGQIPGLQAADTDNVVPAEALADGSPQPMLWNDFFAATYAPSSAVVTKGPTGLPSPVDELDFSPGGAYSVYNWELFYHVPLTIGIHLSKNQRYAEAQRWFHYIFDPTDDSDGPTPERFWQFRPFRYTDAEMVESIILNLSTGAAGDSDLRDQTIHCIHAWSESPFRPHLVARYRPTAYRYKAVMAYLQNLIDWGDSLFSSDLGEAISEALQLYVLAADILGPRPQEVPASGKVGPQTYADLRGSLSDFGDALRDLETSIPFDTMPIPSGRAVAGQHAALQSVGTALYFCVPRNAGLIKYWDIVADRLFKIRNSLNILGVFRQLPLFDPPIDPAMLARAVAAGVDISAIVNGANQPLPLVRYSVLAAKATELCQEVKALGSGLLAAIEKQDGEALGALRSRHESAMLGLAETVKYAQVQDARKAREGAEKSLAIAVIRYTYYEHLLNNAQVDPLKGIQPLDTNGLDTLNFSGTELTVNQRDIKIDIAKDVVGAAGGKLVSSMELLELIDLAEARAASSSAEGLDQIAAALGAIPGFGAHFQPLGPGGSISFGGSNIAAIFTAISASSKAKAAQLAFEAGNAAKMAGYDRRQQDWAQQSNLAAGEIEQVLKQLRGAQIREYIAQKELDNHRAQMEHAAEINAFLDGEKSPTIGQTKTSTIAFYTWMRSEVRGLYARCFDLAMDVARKAERALQHELGDDQLRFIDVGYMGGREGLLAGEKLAVDLKRMELAYLDHNQREYELTRHVSLLQLDPAALVQLRATGSCRMSIPETVLCFDTPSHYFARIKSVAVSIPSVVGPYSGVRCSLRLLKSQIRKDPSLYDNKVYELDPANADDDRFDVHYSSLEAIVTSSAQNDAGLFDVNLRDERYLPFEGHGVVSDWQIDLPADFRQFDYQSITDVMLHVRYTAREGGERLGGAAVNYLQNQVKQGGATDTVRLFSGRSDFSTAWAAFTADPDPTHPATLTVDIRAEHYPFWAMSRVTDAKAKVVEVRLYARLADASTSLKVSLPAVVGAIPVEFVADDTYGDVLVAAISLDAEDISPIGKLGLLFDQHGISDLWFAVSWI